MAPFNNVHCRLAVAYGINQDTIDNLVLHGTHLPLYTVLPKGVLGWYPGTDNPHYNPAMAKQELAQSPGGLHNVKVPYDKTSTDDDNKMAVIQSTLSQVGITIVPTPMTELDFFKLVSQPLSKSKVAIADTGWGGAFPDGEQFFDWLLWPGLPFNVSDYNNPTVTQLTKQADITANRAARANLYIRASHLVLSEGGMIMTGQSTAFGMIKPWVHGMRFSYAWAGFEPLGMNWANVSISPH
jgi:peptide/nickel transport system substrate-binding protein